LENIHFSKIAHFRPFFEQKLGHDLGSFAVNRGVEIDQDTTKYCISMVLCYNCFEGKHDVCMGKQGLFACDCDLCKKDSKSVNNVMPESVRHVEKH
jgi:hypothetical protein